jgi:Zn-dependent protease
MVESCARRILNTMSWSIAVARPFGIPIRVHLTFLVVVALGALHWAVSHGARGAMFGALATVALFSCVVLHELGHSLAARAFGIRTKQIVLLPIGGVAELDGKPKKPVHDLLIAIAGPAVNVVIAAVLAVALGSAASLGHLQLSSLSKLEPSLATLGATLVAGNVALAVFNLLPVFPLDGGRVLRALLSLRFGEHKSLRIAAGIGQIGAVALAAVALFSGQVLLSAIAVMLFFSAGAARAQGALPDLLTGYSAGDVCEQGAVVFEPATSLQEAARASLLTGQTVFPVALGSELLGVIDRAGLRRASAEQRVSHVTGIMARAWPVVRADRPLLEVLEILSSSSATVAAVHQDEVLVGFISAEHLYGNVIPALTTRRPSSVRPNSATREPA